MLIHSRFAYSGEPMIRLIANVETLFAFFPSIVCILALFLAGFLTLAMTAIEGFTTSVVYLAFVVYSTRAAYATGVAYGRMHIAPYDASATCGRMDVGAYVEATRTRPRGQGRARRGGPGPGFYIQTRGKFV